MNTASELPARRIFHLPGGEAMAFRRIEAPAPFRMGSRGYDSDEEPIHRVRLRHVYWLAETPVTQVQFKDWTSRAQIEHKNEFPDRPKNPAENLSWHQAVQYCDWLTQEILRWNTAEPVTDGCTQFCLPTEAEWEFAARVGGETEYWNGDGEAALQQVGWFDEGYKTDGTHAVEEKPPNPFGLFDVHGNVWEWCHDLYQCDAYRSRAGVVVDPGFDFRAAEYRREIPQMLADKSTRVLRGGSWDYSARYCRSAFRDRRWAGVGIINFGFRVCLVRGPSPAEAAKPGTRPDERAERAPTPGDGGRGTRPESDGGGAGDAVDLAQGQLPNVQSDVF